MRLSPKQFDAVIRRAVEAVPAPVRRYLDEVVITVKDRPTRQMLESVGLGPGDTLFGLYEGTSLDRRSGQDLAPLPDTIYIFQKPLEEACRTKTELVREIGITVVHEVAHLVGMEEEDLRRLGYE